VTSVEVIKGPVIVMVLEVILGHTKLALVEALKGGKAYHRWLVLEEGQLRPQEEQPWSKRWMESSRPVVAILSACAALYAVGLSVPWATWRSPHYPASTWNRGCQP
jgi:hypothetical protein